MTDKNQEAIAFTTIAPDTLKVLSDDDLARLNGAFNVAWDEHQAGQPLPEGLSLEEFINRRKFTLEEFRRREQPFPVISGLDQAVRRSTDTNMTEAFHLRDVHWVPVPESGNCPASHPTKLKFPDTDTLRCFRPPAARIVRSQMREQAMEKLTNERARLRPASPGNPTERCGFCTYFEKPATCKIVEGPVSADQVCDWIFSRNTDAGLYNISDEDWIAFGKGMINKQPYQHIVKDVAITPAGPLVMIEDTADPKHRFSLDKKFHVAHTSLEHHWTQEEVDELVAVGNQTQVQEGHDEQSNPRYDVLKTGKVKLSPEERDIVMKAKAVWHHGPNGEESPAVWKSVVSDKEWFVTNTHRAFNVTPTLKGAIDRYHKFIKMTASTLR